MEEAAGKGGGMMGLFRDCMFPPVRKVQDECYGEEGGMGVHRDSRPEWSHNKGTGAGGQHPSGCSGAQTHRGF